MRAVNETQFFRNMRNLLEAETLIEKDGVNFEITTMKRYGGNLVTTLTQVIVKDDENCKISEISFENMMASKTLISEKIRATKNAVLSQHKKALEIFKNSKQ